MSESNQSPLHVVALQVENVKRIQAVAIRPEGSVVVIGGQNAQGKTSLLDSLEMALGGGKTIPAEPVRRGARKARIVADLGELVVERTFTPKGTALEVRNAAGVPQRSPQALLDKLCSKVAFDPLSFAREEPRKQDAILKEVLGLDFSELDQKRAQLYEQRRDTKRDAKQIEARVDAMVLHIGVPDEEVSVAELLAELERRNGSAAEKDRLERRASAAERDVLVNELAIRASRTRVEQLEEELRKAREELADHERDLEVNRARYQECQAEAEVFTFPDPEEVRTQLAAAEETNRKVRENRQHKQLERELREKERQVESLTSAIEAIDAQKAEQLAAAQFPVPGLGFDETGPTLNGIPLEQASQAERLRVSVAIGAALNPRVKVMLVRDGSLLDEESMRLLAELAEETGSQLWVERVGDGDASAIVIEDGMVRDGTEAQGAAE